MFLSFLCGNVKAVDFWLPAMMLGMRADKGQFDEVLSRMLAKPPQKTSEIKAEKKAEAKPKPSRKSAQSK